MTATEQISIDALDDAEQRSDAWQGYQGQRRNGTIPRGTYDCTLKEVAVVRKRGGGWALRMLAHNPRVDRYILAWRGLAEDGDDPYDLSAGQLKGLRKFAESIGVTGPHPPQQIVQSIVRMVDGPVTAKVSQTAAGQAATLSRDSVVPEVLPSTSGAPFTCKACGYPEARWEQGTTNLRCDHCGERQDAVESSGQRQGAISLRGVNPTGEVLDGAAGTAYESHTLVVEGLHASRLGLAQAARGCAELVKTDGWVALGFPTIGEYLASPEITVGRSQFYRLADIWNQYVLEGGVGPERLSIEESKLEVPLPALKQGVVSAEQAVADAEAMTRNDLRQHYRELLGNEPEPEPGPPGDSRDTGHAASPGDEESRQRDDDDGFYDPAAHSERATDDDVIVHGNEWRRERDAARQRVEELEDRAAELETRARAAEDRADALSKELDARPHQTDLEHLAYAQELSAMLERILLEVGRPEQKRMSKALRAAVLELLRQAPEHGLDVGAVDLGAADDA